MFKIQLVYEDDKRYTFSFDEVVDKILTKEQIEKITIKILKEIQKQ